MTEKDKEARRIAADAGLGPLDDTQLAHFGKGIDTGRDLAARLPKNLHWSEEPTVIPTFKPSQRRAP